MSLPTPVLRYTLNDATSLGTNLESSLYNSTATNVSVVADTTYGNVAEFVSTGEILMDTVGPPCLVGAAARSTSIWVSVDELNSFNSVMVYGNSSGSGMTLTVKLSDNQVRFDASGLLSRSLATTLTAGSWYHIGFTYDGTTAKMFVNGSLGDTDTVTLNTLADLHSMGAAYGLGIGFQGRMCDYRIYDSALTDAEIASIYATGPVLSVTLDVTMYTHVAQLSWGDVSGASSYEIRMIEDGGSEEVVGTNLTSTELIVYNLMTGSTYDFMLYSDLDSEIVSSNTGVSPPILDATTSDNTLNFLGNDLTLVDESSVSGLQPFFGSFLLTEEQLVSRVEYRGTLVKKSSVSFVKDSETISIVTNDTVLTPFVLGGSAGQSVNLELSDTTTTSVTYDETTGSITVNSVVYPPGSKFILDGKSVKVAEIK